MKIKHLTLLSISLGLFISCIDKKEYSLEVCEELSMKYFRGLPKPSKQFKDNCGKYMLRYNQEVCKKALQDLMLGGDEKRLQKKYGDKIMGCFNQGDLDRFLNKHD